MNKRGSAPEKCPVCGGDVAVGHTTFTTDLGFGVVVVRRVPAQVCHLCGEGWLEDETARRIEQIVEKARREKHELEVLAYTA